MLRAMEVKGALDAQRAISPPRRGGFPGHVNRVQHGSFVVPRASQTTSALAERSTHHRAVAGEWGGLALGPPSPPPSRPRGNGAQPPPRWSWGGGGNPPPSPPPPPAPPV